MYSIAFQLFKVKSYYVDFATITNKTEDGHGGPNNKIPALEKQSQEDPEFKANLIFIWDPIPLRKVK